MQAHAKFDFCVCLRVTHIFCVLLTCPIQVVAGLYRKLMDHAVQEKLFHKPEIMLDTYCIVQFIHLRGLLTYYVRPICDNMAQVYQVTLANIAIINILSLSTLYIILL